MLSVIHSVSDYTTILSVTHSLTTVLSVTRSASTVRYRILLLRPLLCHRYCPRAARIENEESDLQRNKDQYNVRTCARSEDDEHATGSVSTSFRTSSTQSHHAIGLSSQAHTIISIRAHTLTLASGKRSVNQEVGTEESNLKACYAQARSQISRLTPRKQSLSSLSSFVSMPE